MKRQMWNQMFGSYNSEAEDVLYKVYYRLMVHVAFIRPVQVVIHYCTCS
jgi:hypothetical protein